MTTETWMTAEDAKQLNFTDETNDEKQVAACLDAGMLSVNGIKMDLSRYKNPPKMIVATPQKPQNNPNELDKDQLFLLENALKTKKSKYQEVK
jgi:hypothetical protein